MTVKKICIILVLLLFLAATVWFVVHYFHTSKQIYEGVLVYNRDCSVEQLYYQA